VGKRHPSASHLRTAKFENYNKKGRDRKMIKPKRNYASIHHNMYEEQGGAPAAYFRLAGSGDCTGGLERGADLS
jgi:hypothetical protein